METCLADYVKVVNPSVYLDTRKCWKEGDSDGPSVMVEKGMGKKEDSVYKLYGEDSVIFESPSRRMFRAGQRCGKAKP